MMFELIQILLEQANQTQEWGPVYTPGTMAAGIIIAILYILLAFGMEMYDRRRGIIGCQWHHKYIEKGVEEAKKSEESKS